MGVISNAEATGSAAYQLVSPEESHDLAAVGELAFNKALAPCLSMRTQAEEMLSRIQSLANERQGVRRRPVHPHAEEAWLKANNSVFPELERLYGVADAWSTILSQNLDNLSLRQRDLQGMVFSLYNSNKNNPLGVIATETRDAVDDAAAVIVHGDSQKLAEWFTTAIQYCQVIEEEMRVPFCQLEALLQKADSSRCPEEPEEGSRLLNGLDPTAAFPVETDRQRESLGLQAAFLAYRRIIQAVADKGRAYEEWEEDCTNAYQAAALHGGRVLYLERQLEALNGIFADADNKSDADKRREAAMACEEIEPMIEAERLLIKPSLGVFETVAQEFWAAYNRLENLEQ